MLLRYILAKLSHSHNSIFEKCLFGGVSQRGGDTGLCAKGGWASAHCCLRTSRFINEPLWGLLICQVHWEFFSPLGLFRV